MSSTYPDHDRHHYRISKFDPEAPASARAGDWTSISDVGQRFGCRVLRRSDYEQTEQKYLDAVRRMLASSGAHELTVSDVLWPPGAIATVGIIDGMVVGAEAAVDLCRSQLREELCCHLEAENGFAIDIGFDFYVYITSPVPLDDAIDAIHASGLVVEHGVPSPYFIE